MRNADCRAQGMVLDPARAERDEADRSGTHLGHDDRVTSLRSRLFAERELRLGRPRSPQNEYSNPITGDTPLFSPELVVRGKSTCAEMSKVPVGLIFTPAVPNVVLRLPGDSATVATVVVSTD